MDWTDYIDAYCERLAPGLWAEPINALTNLAFLIAAAIMWPRTKGLPLGRLMCVVLAVIGVGSGLFHTFATRWASTADVVPIGLFILLYIFAASRDFLRLPWWGAALAVVLFFPYAALSVPLFRALPLYGASAAYMPVPVLIALYGVILARRAPATARGLWIGAALLMASLTFRSLDMPTCEATHGIGTHFMWHVLNGTMLGWMIAVYRRHMLAVGAPGR